jgi:hypothetical protein
VTGHLWTVLIAYGTRTGCVKAPLPAESQAENRTHFFPEESNGTWNRCDPNGG